MGQAERLRSQKTTIDRTSLLVTRRLKWCSGQLRAMSIHKSLDWTSQLHPPLIGVPGPQIDL